MRIGGFLSPPPEGPVSANRHSFGLDSLVSGLQESAEESCSPEVGSIPTSFSSGQD